MFYIAVCDDNQRDLSVVVHYLKSLRKHNFQLEIVPFTNGLDLLQYYKKGKRFDLLILDMLMEPINGIEVAKHIRNYDADVPIMIVTATVEFALDGYKVNAYRYILKPIDGEHFRKEVRDVLLKRAKEQSQYYKFTNENGLHKILLADIFYFESNVRTITIFKEKGCFAYTDKISDVELALQGQPFVRVHKSFIVNMKHISNIFKDVITMDNGDEVPLSRFKSKDVRELFLEYMKGNI